MLHAAAAGAADPVGDLEGGFVEEGGGDPQRERQDQAEEEPREKESRAAARAGRPRGGAAAQPPGEGGGVDQREGDDRGPEEGVLRQGRIAPRRRTADQPGREGGAPQGDREPEAFRQVAPVMKR